MDSALRELVPNLVYGPYGGGSPSAVVFNKPGGNEMTKRTNLPVVLLVGGALVCCGGCTVLRIPERLALEWLALGHPPIALIHSEVPAVDFWQTRQVRLGLLSYYGPTNEALKYYKQQLQDQVAQYLQQFPELPEKRHLSLQHLTVIEGMPGEEVLLLIGSPDEIQHGKPRYPGLRPNVEERWLYKHVWSGRYWSYLYFSFQHGLLVEIAQVVPKWLP